MKLLDPDSPFMQALTYIGNLMLLNLLFLLCCLPVVTIGASVTALYSVTLTKTDAGVASRFFRAFRRNFRQATILWLLLLVFGVLLAADYYCISVYELPAAKLLTVLFFIGVFFYLPTLTFVFPVLARYDNTVFGTLKNAMALGIAKLPQTVVMLALNVLPLILLYFNQVLFLRTLILWLLLACAVTARINSCLLRRIFRKLSGAAPESPV